MQQIQQWIQEETIRGRSTCTINVQDLLAASENVDADFLRDQTLATIAKDIYDVLTVQDFDTDEVADFCQKLREYRYVDQLHQLHKGKSVRWIRLGTSGAPYLTNGGIVVDVKFLDNGTHILCKNKTRFIQYRFDDCLTFQRLTADEQLVLTCMEFIRK